MYRHVFASLLFFSSLVSTAQLKSPEEFLGYRIGTRFTPHWKLVDYYRSVAAAMPSMIKLEQYGQTSEGRPLLVAYVASAANLSNLENIRSNNLQLAARASGQPIPGSMPAIVWLSYNVHGNEASSSEASMLTLYALVDPKQAETKTWLQTNCSQVL